MKFNGSLHSFIEVTDDLFTANRRRQPAFITQQGNLVAFIRAQRDVDNRRVNRLRRRPRGRNLVPRKQIGYLPEGAPLYSDMTPPDFLQFVGRMRGLNKARRAAAITDVMQKLELQSVAHKRIDELSKGFKRRVGIAQAILHDPAVLILDEPTDGLDPNQKHQVRQLIRNLSTDKIVILSTHILEEVSAVCNRAVVIANGKLLADDSPAALQARSRFHQAVTLQFPQSTDMRAVNIALENLPAVGAIEVAIDEPRRITALADPGLTDRSRVFEEVTGLLEQQGWNNVSVYVESGRLDDVFMEITGGLSS